MNIFVEKFQDKVVRAIQKIRLDNRDFTVFSNDCWGTEVYKYFNLPYNTPFVGLMLMVPCYIKFLQNPQYYLAQSLKFVHSSRYDEVRKLQEEKETSFPIATLGDDVEIQFLHYHSAEEAQEKWTRRVERINWNNIVVKMDGSKGYANEELMKVFNCLHYRKLLLLAKPISGINSGIVVPHYTDNGMLLFRRSLAVFDLVGWLNTGNYELSNLQKMYYKLLY